MKGVLIMLQYNIHLRTINDFRNYANMIVRFNIAGFVRVRKEEINMYDILEIMSQGPVDSMILNLTNILRLRFRNLSIIWRKPIFLMT